MAAACRSLLATSEYSRAASRGRASESSCSSTLGSSREAVGVSLQVPSVLVVLSRNITNTHYRRVPIGTVTHRLFWNAIYACAIYTAAVPPPRVALAEGGSDGVLLSRRQGRRSASGQIRRRLFGLIPRCTVPQAPGLRPETKQRDRCADRKAGHQSADRALGSIPARPSRASRAANRGGVPCQR